MMRFDVEFFGGALLGGTIGLVVGLSIGAVRGDFQGVPDFEPRMIPRWQLNEAIDCQSRWVLPDGSSLCVDAPERFQQLLDAWPECRLQHPSPIPPSRR